MGTFALTFKDNGATTFALNFLPPAQDITAPAIATAEALFAPAAGLGVAPGAVASAEALYAPALGLVLPVDATVGTAEALFVPAAELGVAPAAIGSLEALYAPELEVELVVPLLDDGVVYTPFLGTALFLGAIASEAQVFAPRADLGLTPALIDAGAIYAPRADMQVLAPEPEVLTVFYDPTAILDSDTQVLVIPLLEAGVIYTPIFTTGVPPSGTMFGVRVVTPRARGVRVLTPRARGVRVVR